jgi:hypothetical protein
MSRTILPLASSDISQFTKALRAQLSHADGVPSHVQLLNMICRAAGHGNFQSFRAMTIAPQAAGPTSDAAPEEQREPALDLKRIQRAARCFDAEGRLLRWPSRRSDQILALWGLWASLPARIRMSEREVSDRIKELHHFGDHAILRRELCNLGLMVRTRDGRVYRRVEKPLPGAVAVLFGELGAQRAATGG